MLHVLQLDKDRDALKSAGVDSESLIDDGTDWAGKIVEKPWGYESEIYRAGPVSIWRLVLNPGAETSMHCHTAKETVLIVESGECVLETFAGSKALRAGDVVTINKGAFHRTRAPKGAVVLEIETPTNKRDLVRIQDRYGRAGQGY
jgi:mannose-6-phosphate isomerase-like protein (cupin superfamily)